MGNSDTLKLLIEHIEESGPYVLATPEDAEYFRRSFKKEKPKEVVVPAALKFVPPPPAPPSLPKPVIIEKIPEPLPEAPPKPIPLDFSTVRNVLSIVAPELAILNDIPSDITARKIAERWKTKNQTAPISILVYQEPPEQRNLLEEMALALDVYFGPAKIVNAESIEKEKQWEAFLSVADLKMIIVCDYTLWQLNGLMQFYKETPAQGTRILGNVPLFLLPDLSLYLKDPLLKRSLWKALCQKFS